MAALNQPDDEMELHFEDRPDIPHPTAQLLSRGNQQPVRMGRRHPLARCFPESCSPMAAPDLHLVTMPLHRVIEICASVCAAPNVIPT
jgi:hypothetical protein